MKKRIMFSVILLLMPLFVNAQAVNISCPKEISLNETFVCTITGTSDKLITSISADLQYGDKLIFQSFTSDWNGACIDNKIGLYTALDKIGTFNIGVVKFKNNGIGNNSVTLNNIKFYDTCSLLLGLDDIFNEPFVISSITLEELEHIKTSAHKDIH